ncbi:MAG: hypothetical protein CMF96_04900 [Candidatus Marinimicrobia bacterium]|nr:hypothetical protein [Candidatus Neomarinimicrobiota bacterium]
MVIFFSCEMKFPEDWQQPSWHLPINFPIQDETYFFSALVDSNTIYLDSDSTLIILFREDTLKGPNGELVGIDSTFNSYFRIDGLTSPNIEGIEINPIEIEGFDTSFSATMNLNDFGEDFTTANCFPDVILNDMQPISNNFSETIYDANEIELFNSIDSITVIDGLLSVFVFNEFPFEITALKIDMFTANEPIWQVEINNIGENESESRSRPISEVQPLSLKESIYFHYEIIIESQIGNDVCFPGTGWDLNGDFSRSLLVNFDLNFQEIGTIAGNIVEIPYEQDYQVIIPNPNDIWLSGGLLSYGDSINQLNLGLSNNLFTELEIGLKIIELFEFNDSNQNWSESFDWNVALEKGNSREYIISLENSILRPENSENDTLKHLNLIFSGLIPSQDIELNPNISYSFLVDTVLIKPIQLDYINAIFQKMNFASPSIEINDVPEGFEGFSFADVTLDLNIYNQIGVPVNLDMFLAGINDGDTTYVPLKDSIFSPLFVDGYQVGDIVHSNIKMTGTHQYSTWYNNYGVVRQDTILLESSFLDLMNFAPEEIIVGGVTELNGSGTLALNTFVWGDFELKLPLKFKFEEELNIVPLFTTELNPINDESKQQIDNGLVSANLHVNIENHSALAMTLSLLVSTEENYFPHYLDKLISGSLVTNQTIIENNSENDFNLLSSLNIARIEVETLSEDESRALRVIFRDQNLNIVFWVGRIADIIIPEAEDVNSVTGHVIKSGYGEDIIKLSVEKMEWLTTGEKRYSRPMIEFIGTGENPRTLRSTDYLKISSYISIVLDTGGI